MCVEAQSAGCRNAGVLLPQRPGGGVARIGKGRFALLCLLLIQGLEIVEPHEDLATDLHKLGDVLGRPRQVLRDGLNGSDVQGDVLAGYPVSPGQPLLQDPVVVEEVQGQPVDLDLAGHGEGLVFGPIQVLADSVVPLAEFVDAEYVVQAEHPGGMTNGGEIVGEGPAHSVGRRLGGVQTGEA